MAEKKRKYYRVKVKRISPYNAVNGSYYLEEDVYAYSKKGAMKSVEKYHGKGYGYHIPVEVKEITKDEFRGHHEQQ